MLGSTPPLCHLPLARVVYKHVSLLQPSVVLPLLRVDQLCIHPQEGLHPVLLVQFRVWYLHRDSCRPPRIRALRGKLPQVNMGLPNPMDPRQARHLLQGHTHT